MLPHDQRRSHGEDGQGYHSRSDDECRRAKEGPRRPRQTVQVPAGRAGSVEGRPVTSPPIPFRPSPLSTAPARLTFLSEEEQCANSPVLIGVGASSGMAGGARPKLPHRRHPRDISRRAPSHGSKCCSPATSLVFRRWRYAASGLQACQQHGRWRCRRQIPSDGGVDELSGRLWVGAWAAMASGCPTGMPFAARLLGADRIARVGAGDTNWASVGGRLAVDGPIDGASLTMGSTTARAAVAVSSTWLLLYIYTLLSEVGGSLTSPR